MAEDLARMGDGLERLHERIAAVLGPRRKQLTEAVMAEIDQEAVDRMAATFVDETRIKSMDFRNGAHMDIQPAREIVAAWVAAARAMLGDAPNYCETEIDFGLADPPGYEMDVKLAGECDHYVFRVQRRGRLTPHQARQAAEERAVAAEARLAELENAITWNTSCTSCAATLDAAYAETARREAAEGKLAEARSAAGAWAALAPPDEWGESTADTIKSDCGRAILAITGSKEDGALWVTRAFPVRAARRPTRSRLAGT